MLDKTNYSLLCGNAIEVLKTLPEKSIQTCITSPPYYGLRDYGTGKWVGGDENCPHYRTSKFSENTQTGHLAMGEQGEAIGDAIYKTVCPLCGAIRIDEQIGLEETPEQYVERLVEVFREVKRVLKDDGTLWLNLGDTYNGNKQGNTEYIKRKELSDSQNFMKRIYSGAKQKDLIGIPWMVAFALRADGWYLRNDIIWEKPNPMPAPVRDRCVCSHEYIFLLSKKSHYLFNWESIATPTSDISLKRAEYGWHGRGLDDTGSYSGMPQMEAGELKGRMVHEVARKRDVWRVGVNTYKGAHFATYPIELITPCVLARSNVGDTILDPFNGSGTTGIASLVNDRKYIGIDLNQKYIDLAHKRINEELYGVKSIEEKENKSDYEKAELI